MFRPTIIINSSNRTTEKAHKLDMAVLRHLSINYRWIYRTDHSIGAHYVLSHPIPQQRLDSRLINDSSKWCRLNAFAPMCTTYAKKPNEHDNGAYFDSLSLVVTGNIDQFFNEVINDSSTNAIWGIKDASGNFSSDFMIWKTWPVALWELFLSKPLEEWQSLYDSVDSFIIERAEQTKLLTANDYEITNLENYKEGTTKMIVFPNGITDDSNPIIDKHSSSTWWY